MTRPTTFGRAFAAVVCLASTLGLAQAGGAQLTRRDLAIRLARAAGIELPETGSDQTATEALKKRGIDLGPNPKGLVTQEMLVEVGRAVGVSFSTSAPKASVSPAVGAAFVQSIQVSLQGAGAEPGASATVSASCRGRESRSHRRGTPASNANPNATADPCEEPIP